MIDTGEPAIQISSFAVGTGGYSPSNPSVALSPDPAATALINEIFRSRNVAREYLNLVTRVYVGVCNPGEAIGSLGEVGVFATYLTGPLAGTEFLFGLANMPMKSKTSSDLFTFRMPVVI
jgi:hypothetical protein